MQDVTLIRSTQTIQYHDKATRATMLSKGMYGPSQTMAVTGHKSVQSHDIPEGR